MVSLSPRLSPKLVRELERLAEGELTVAEICRRVGAAADHLGAPRPSYESVRLLVHEIRQRREQPSTSEVLVDIALRARPPDALVDHLSGVGVPKSK